MSVSVIICGGGSGSRSGLKKNKLLYSLGGMTVLEKSVTAFLRDDISEIIVTASAVDFDEFEKLLSGYDNVKVVSGGATRTKSVENALKAVTGEYVLIHDGARPFVTQKIITDCIETVKKYGTAICALPVTDTTSVREGNVIKGLLRRDELVKIQTPQAFKTAEIIRAFALAEGKDFTDESSLYASVIEPPHLFDGDECNKKLTYREDFSKEERIVVGVGIDTHAFGKEQDYIMLGGVKIPSDSGLIAHSDGDVLIHALMDSMFSACGLPDIGHYFPDTDERYRGIDSAALLEICVEEIKKLGYKVGNTSIAIQAQKPRLYKYIVKMRERLADILGVSVEKVGITAGTNEGLGYVGEGKGITVYAYTMLEKID